MRIEDDVINYIVIAFADSDEPLPSLSGIFGLINLPGAGAEQNTARIARVGGKAADISAIRTDGDKSLCLNKK